VPLKDWSERTDSALDARNLPGPFMGMNAGIKDAIVLAFNPPPIMGMSTTGGFEVYVQDRTGAGYTALAQATQALVAAAAKRPELAGVRSMFNTAIPQYKIDVDREKAKALGVPIASIFQAMQATFGSLYVNDFTLYGRNYRVSLASEGDFRQRPEDLRYVFVRGGDGAMIPIDALVKTRRIVGRTRSSASTSSRPPDHGRPGAGLFLRPGDRGAGAVAKEALPQGYALCLDRLGLPGAGGRRLRQPGAAVRPGHGVPDPGRAVRALDAADRGADGGAVRPVRRAPGGVAARAREHVYFQIGLVTLIGLAAKNAIPIANSRS